MSYGEIGIWLWVITSLWLWGEAISYLRRPVSNEHVKDIRKLRRRLLLVATIGYTIAWLMFLPFLYIVFSMARH